MSHMFRDVLANYVTTESQIIDGGFIFVIIFVPPDCKPDYQSCGLLAMCYGCRDYEGAGCAL